MHTKHESFNMEVISTSSGPIQHRLVCLLDGIFVSHNVYNRSTRSNLFWFNTNYLTFPVGVLDIPYSNGMT